MRFIQVEGARLAVPPMHPDIPQDVRVQIYELVLRRLIGEAYDLAAAAEEARLDRCGSHASTASLMSKQPYVSSRKSGLAA